MNKLFIFLIIICIFSTAAPNGIALEINEFEMNMDVWNNKAALASKYLQKAEEALKKGDKIQGCSDQKKAGGYGIEATEALIKAFEINGNAQSEVSNLNNGLNKWRELRDFC